MTGVFGRIQTINFPNVSVWDRSLFKHFDKYCVMNKYNGVRTKIIEDSYVFDCEKMPNGFIVLDCYKAFSKVIDEKPFLERLKIADTYIKRNNLKDFTVIKAEKITSLKELFERLESTNLDDNIDGLVLRNLKDTFQTSRSYKLKTSKLSTIDFRVRSSKLFVWKDGKEVLYKYPLLKGSSEYLNAPLFKEIYTESEIATIEELKKQNLEGLIVEMSWDGFSWQPLKIRSDKTRPNKLEFALSNSANIYYQISIENVFKEYSEFYVNTDTRIISEEKAKGLVEADDDMIMCLQMKQMYGLKCFVEGSKGFRLMIFEEYGLY